MGFATINFELVGPLLRVLVILRRIWVQLEVLHGDVDVGEVVWLVVLVTLVQLHNYGQPLLTQNLNRVDWSVKHRDVVHFPLQRHVDFTIIITYASLARYGS